LIKKTRFYYLIKNIIKNTFPTGKYFCSNRKINNLYFIVQGDVNSAWKHDMFDGVKKVGRGAIGNAGTTKLLVSNLDFGVSDSDIQVLKYYI